MAPCKCCRSTAPKRPLKCRPPLSALTCSPQCSCRHLLAATHAVVPTSPRFGSSKPQHRHQTGRLDVSPLHHTTSHLTRHTHALAHTNFSRSLSLSGSQRGNLCCRLLRKILKKWAPRRDLHHGHAALTGGVLDTSIPTAVLSPPPRPPPVLPHRYEDEATPIPSRPRPWPSAFCVSVHRPSTAGPASVAC